MPSSKHVLTGRVELKWRQSERSPSDSLKITPHNFRSTIVSNTPENVQLFRVEIIVLA